MFIEHSMCFAIRRGVGLHLNVCGTQGESNQEAPKLSLQTVSLNGSAMLSFVSMLLFVCHWAVHEWNITGTSLTMSGLDACLARASVNHEVHVFTHEGFGCAPCMHGPPYPSHCTFMGKLWFVFSFFPCALMWDALIPVAASSPIFPPCYQCPFFFVFGIGAPIISPAGSCP